MFRAMLETVETLIMEMVEAPIVVLVKGLRPSSPRALVEGEEGWPSIWDGQSSSPP